MQCWKSIAVVVAASSVPGVAGVSVFAQSDTRARTETSASATLARHSPPSVLRVYNSEPLLISASVTIPPNLIFQEIFRSTLTSMLDRSPTFRRQCLRIAETPALLVRLRMVQDASPSKPSAYSQIAVTSDGRVVANVSIRPPDKLIELIAHEIEHVIEQLDGIDLRARSELSGSDVWSCNDGSFETRRAVRIGRAVAHEASRAR